MLCCIIYYAARVSEKEFIKMRLSTSELFNIGTSLIEKLEGETNLDLYRFQSLLKPILEPFYNPDEHLDRFRNHSYRMMKLLVEKGVVVRLSGAFANNARYMIVTDTDPKQLSMPLDDSEAEVSVSEEASYQAQLRASKTELTRLVVAHKELLQKFPSHSGYLKAEIDKLSNQISMLEYQDLVLSKLITHSADEASE